MEKHDTLTRAIIPKTYAELRRSVEETLLTGQRLIEQAKVRTYHETGRLIAEHLRLHVEESNYGTQTMLQLAADLKVSDSVLYRCVRFVASFPILAARPKLTWGHYRLLIPVADVAQRKVLEREPDKYDRYLADVFLAVPPDPPSVASTKEGAVFLNNALLENGHAGRKDAWQFGDWEPDLIR